MKDLLKLEKEIKARYKKLEKELKLRIPETRKIKIRAKMQTYEWFFAYVKRERRLHNG